MIEGTWDLIGGEQNGEAEPAEDLERSSLIIEGDRHTVTIGDAVLMGTHALDTSQSPMTIDANDTAGPFEGMSLQGIFKVENDVLTVCFAAPGEQRPADFTTKEQKATLLHVWKRQT